MQIVVDGLLVNHHSYGEISKPCFLILHGWGAEAFSWEYISKRLSKDYFVVVPDLPGFGKSFRPSQTWGVNEYSEFVKKFLKKLNLNPTIILGHSFGGRIAVMLSSNSNYEKVFLVDSAGLEVQNEFLAVLVKLLKPLIPIKFRKIFRSTDYKNVGNMSDIFKKVISENLTSVLTNITSQTYVIWGENDKTLSLKYAYVFKENIKNSLLRIVWGAKHHPHIEKEDQFYEVLEECLYDKKFV